MGIDTGECQFWYQFWISQVYIIIIFEGWKQKFGDQMMINDNFWWDTCFRFFLD